MNNPWELRSDDTRESDNLHTFLIFCEDETSECEYFRFFETEKIKINIFPNRKNTIENVVKAISYCKQNGIIREDNDVVDGFEVWCVYDRDLFVGDSRFEENKVRFNIASKAAESHKINVAWSNDAFELWIILHLTDLDDINNYKHRDIYYSYLDNYFKDKEDKSNRLQKILAHGTFSYKKDLKSKKNFTEIVRNEIIPHTYVAIERSKRIELIHKGKSDLTEWCPCTLVHNLVERLLDKGQKRIEYIT